MTTTPRVFSYWEGPMPPWIGLCLDTMRRNIPGVEILTRRQWREMYDFRDVPGDKLAKQLPNLRSDFIRAWLLKTYGGIWVDADCIVFRDLRPIDQHLDKADFVAYRIGPPTRSQCSALIASRPGGRLIKAYYGAMVARLNNHCCRLPRLALGPNLLARTIRRTRANVHQLPTDMVHPLHWRHRRRNLMAAGTVTVPEDAYCFMATHRALRPASTWPAAMIRASDTVFGEMIRRAEPSPVEPPRTDATDRVDWNRNNSNHDSNE